MDALDVGRPSFVRVCLSCWGEGCRRCGERGRCSWWQTALRVPGWLWRARGFAGYYADTPELVRGPTTRRERWWLGIKLTIGRDLGLWDRRRGWRWPVKR